MADFHPYLEDPVNVRLLKEIALAHEQLGRRNSSARGAWTRSFSSTFPPRKFAA